MKQKGFSPLFKSEVKRLTKLFGVFLLIAAIPITVFVSSQQQQIQQHAAIEPTPEVGPAQLSLYPNTLLVSSGDSFIADVVLDAKTNNVSGIDITLKFDPGVLSLRQFTPSGAFSTVLANRMDNNQGTLHYAAATLQTQPLTGKITLGELLFAAKASGASIVSFDNIKITQPGIAESLAIQESITGNYIVEPKPTSTPLKSILPPH